MFSLRKISVCLAMMFIAIGCFFISAHISPESSTTGGSFALSLGEYTYAATGDTNQSTDNLKVYNTLINALNMVAGILIVFISPLIIFGSWLMSPDWTSGDLFGLRVPMHDVWKTVANVVYIIYAVLLIVIALATMFNSQNYGYKKLLGKLFIGLLITPFTWFFVQWTISIATYVTAQVVTIPVQTIIALQARQGTTNDTFWDDPLIPKTIDVKNIEADVKPENTLKKCQTQEEKKDCLSIMEVLRNSSGTYGHLLVYAYAVIKIDTIKLIETGKVDPIKSAGQLVSEGLSGFIFFLVFCFLVVTLVFILFMRAIKLWIYAIFSPVYTLAFVAGDLFKSSDQKDELKISEFVGLAFVPAVIGFVLSFGLIIIAAIGNGSSNTSGTTEQTCTGDMLKSSGCTIGQVAGNPQNSITRKIEQATSGSTPIDGMGPTKEATWTEITSVKLGGITVNFFGKIGGLTDVNSQAENISKISPGGGAFGKIITNVIALVFLWIAFRAAVNTSSFAKKTSQSILEMGGSLAKALPGMIPLPKMMGGSVAGLNYGINQIKQIPSSKASSDFNKSDMAKWIADLSGQSTGNAQTKNIFNTANADINKASMEKLGEHLRDLHRVGKGDIGGAYQEDIKNLLTKLADKSDGEQKAFLKNSGIRDNGVISYIIDMAKKTKEKPEDFNISKAEQFTAAMQGADAATVKSPTLSKTYSKNKDAATSAGSDTTTVTVNSAEINIPSAKYDASNTLENQDKIVKAFTDSLTKATAMEGNTLKTDIKTAIKNALEQEGVGLRGKPGDINNIITAIETVLKTK